jgi:hypothetical protein
VEQDQFNRLIVGAHVGWEQALLFRASFRFLRQGVVRHSEGYVLEVLLRYPELVRGLADLFEARFDPDVPSRAPKVAELRRRVEGVLEPVSRLDEATAAQHPRPGVAFRLLENAPPIPVWLAWWKDNPPPSLHALTDISRTAYTAHGN